jgi:broad specificity phosphatase PhoE
VQEQPGLIDIDYGQWRGCSRREAQERFPEVYATWLSRPEDAEAPGGESLQAVSDRCTQALRQLIGRHSDETIVVVAHTVVNRLLLCSILGLSISGFWRLRQHTACINEFDWDGKRFTVTELNSTCHLRQHS